MLELTLLGPPFAALNGVRQNLRPRRLGLLAYLALEGPQVRARLAPLFFPDFEPDEARGRLRLELHRTLHSSLGPFLRADGEEIALEAGSDAQRFERELNAGNWTEALALNRGDLLEGLIFDDAPSLQTWLEERRERHRVAGTQALEGQLKQLEDAGQTEAALKVQRELLERQPFSETACDALTRRLEGLGRRHEAVGEQEQFRERFVRELGLEPILTHALTRAHPLLTSQPPEPRPSLLEPPLVGREGLWQQLLEWRDCAPRGQVLLLIGEGGVGKSRLAARFARFSSGEEPVPYLRASESAQSMPFEALLEGLRRAGVARLGALEHQWQLELSALVPEMFMPRLKGRGTGEVQGETRLLEALFQALNLVVSSAPTVVLEDVHWLDASSVRALGHFEKRLRDTATAPRFLATARPGELRQNPPLSRWLADLEREGRLLRLEVSPLSEVAVLKLIRLLSGSPRATGFAQKLHALSGGNPYALLAFVQGLISRGHLETDGPEGWFLNLELADLSHQLPATLRGVLLHTLECRGEAVLKLLEAAAFRGQTFEFEAALAGSGLEENTARTALELALEHRWAVALPEGNYRLEHDLLRQALESHPDFLRSGQIHRRLAQHLDRVGGQSSSRAHHWEAGGEREQAFPLWKQAALEAAGLWAHREALSALEHALNCTDSPVEKIVLHRTRGRHWQALGQLEAWGRELDAADVLQREFEVPGEGLKLALERTHLLMRGGQPERALDHSAAWTEGEMNEDRGLLLHDRAAALLELGRPDEAVKVLEAALERGVDPYSLLGANLNNTLASAAHALKEVDLGLAHAAMAVEGFEKLGRSEGMANALITQACLFDLKGDSVQTHRAVSKALGFARDAGHSKLIRYSLSFLVELMQDTQDFTAGLEYATQGLEFSEQEANSAAVAHFSAALEHFKGQQKTSRNSILEGATQL